MARRSPNRAGTAPRANTARYRCIGTDGYRFGGLAVCDNRSVRADHLEQAVWDRVRALLEAPDRLAGEYRRRLHEAREGTARSEELAQLDRQISALRRGIGRLIDSYAAGVIDRSSSRASPGSRRALPTSRSDKRQPSRWPKQSAS